MRRFFSDDSFWNQPLPANPEIAPRSGHFINILHEPAGNAKQNPGLPWWINCDSYSIPVYEVDENTPRYNVLQWDMPEAQKPGRWKPREKYWSHGPGFNSHGGVPIPDAATPAPGTDMHLALVDWKRNLVWDMWAARKRPDGQWESRTGMVYPANGSGVWQTSDFATVRDDDSIHFHGPGRAAGVPILAGLIMREELLAGEINHKLAFATWHNAFKEFVAPATWTDGFRDGGIPEGAVMQLDPALDLAQFKLSPAALAIARALQRYGMVNVDVAEGNCVYAESPHEPEWNWKGLLTPDCLRGIPLTHYRVLKIGETTKLGDCVRK